MLTKKLSKRKKKTHMLEHQTRSTKFKWLDGGAVNLEHLPDKSNMDPGSKMNPLNLWFLDFWVNQDDQRGWSYSYTSDACV